MKPLSETVKCLLRCPAGRLPPYRGRAPHQEARTCPYGPRAGARGQDVAGRATSLLGPVMNLWLAGSSQYLRMGVVGGQGAGEEVGGGAVEVVPVAVVAAGGAGGGMGERVLDVLQRRPRAQRFGGVGMPRAVRAHAGGKLRGLAEPKELLVGELVAVAVAAVGRGEERPAGAAVEVGVERAHHRRGEGDP